MLNLKVSDVVGIINKFAPFVLSEQWDNSGLQIGNPAASVQRIMLGLDPAQEAIEAAISSTCQLLITHHPLIFTPLKKIISTDPAAALTMLAIKHDLAVLSVHTNYDIAAEGLNDVLARRLGVEACVPLKTTVSEELLKLSVYIPK